MNKKNITIISAVFPPEPVVSASLSKDIACELSKKNKVTVICPNPTRPHGYIFEKEIDDKNHKVVRLDSHTCSESKIIGRLRESYSFGKYCYRYIAENKDEIDIIYANSWPLFAQYFVVREAKKNKLPIVIHVQDIYPESLANKMPYIGPLVNLFLRPMDAWILRNATKVISISPKMKDYLVKSRKINPFNIEVVTNWQNENPFLKLEENDFSTDKNAFFTFMYLGNIGPVAGCNLLIEAFELLKLDNVRLVIAGSGSMKDQLINRVKSFNLKNVEFWPVPDGNVPDTQAQADILLLPMTKGSASFSIPSKLPAYMFSARPIIACVDLESVTAEAILNSGCGWVIEPQNSRALAAKMQEVASLPQDTLQQMGHAGRAYALKFFSKEVNLTRMVSVIESASHK